MYNVSTNANRCRKDLFINMHTCPVDENKN